MEKFSAEIIKSYIIWWFVALHENVTVLVHRNSYKISEFFLGIFSTRICDLIFNVKDFQ